jgi:hypothetical protein
MTESDRSRRRGERVLPRCRPGSCGGGPGGHLGFRPKAQSACSAKVGGQRAASAVQRRAVSVRSRQARPRRSSPWVRWRSCSSSTTGRAESAAARAPQPRREARRTGFLAVRTLAFSTTGFALAFRTDAALRAWVLPRAARLETAALRALLPGMFRARPAGLEDLKGDGPTGEGVVNRGQRIRPREVFDVVVDEVSDDGSWDANRRSRLAGLGTRGRLLGQSLSPPRSLWTSARCSRAHTLAGGRPPGWKRYGRCDLTR